MATFDMLSTTHCPQYINRFLNGELTPIENRRIGFPWSLEGVRRTTSSVGGTVAAMKAVCLNECDVSGHLAGGTHHAFYDRGEGFCVFSDIAVAANIALTVHKEVVQKILIIDLDVHQGNGNSCLFKDNRQVFTLSLHCKDNYFSEKQKSDVDVEVNGGAGDDEYNELVEFWVSYCMKEVRPDLVFFQAGVDIFQGDRLGKLKISREGIRTRNSIVYNAVKNSSARLVITMGGGYPKDLNPTSSSFLDIIGAHIDVYRQCLSDNHV